MLNNNRAVFLDRDGTINRDVGYPGSYKAIEVYDYSFDAVLRINQAGFLAVVVTNQSGIGRGLIEEGALLQIHEKMGKEFKARGARLDAFYYCPHHPQARDPAYRMDCACRKPNPEMGRRAVKDLGIDTSRSYMIGDKVADILFGHNIGARSVLVLTGYGRESEATLKENKIHPDFTALTLKEAVDWILHREAGPGGAAQK